MRKRLGHVGRIPAHDRIEDEVEAGRATLLGLVVAVGDTALPVRADSLLKGMTLFPLIKPAWQRWRSAGFSSLSSMNWFAPTLYQRQSESLPGLVPG